MIDQVALLSSSLMSLQAAEAASRPQYRLAQRTAPDKIILTKSHTKAASSSSSSSDSVYAAPTSTSSSLLSVSPSSSPASSSSPSSFTSQSTPPAAAATAPVSLASAEQNSTNEMQIE
jgi:hypothetical protein